MTRRVRIAAETSPWNPLERFGATARLLADYIAEAQNGLITVTGPWDEEYQVSLDPVADRDPRLFLEILFMVSPEDEDFDAMVHPDAVILAEFGLPSGTALPGE